MPSIAKKRLLRKKLKQHFMSALQKNKSTQTSSSVFAERVEKAKEIKLELELTKIVDFFLYGHSNCESNLVSFKIKSIQQTIYVPKKYKNLVKNEIPNQKNSSLVRF